MIDTCLFQAYDLLSCLWSLLWVFKLDMIFLLKLSTEILNNLEALKAMWLLKKTNAAIKKEKLRSGEEISESTDWNRWVAMMGSVQGQDTFSTFEERHKKEMQTGVNPAQASKLVNRLHFTSQPS